MSLYERWILPRLTHLSMRQKQLAAYRARALAGARGCVLEIGVGSGLNLPFYGHAVQRVLGNDPSPELIRLAKKAAGKANFPVEFLVQSAEEVPFENDSADTTVTTWTLCTIPDAVRALREVRRVLKPEGFLIFVEPGGAPDPKVTVWQDLLTPLWKWCAGGCHLNRKIDYLVRNGGSSHLAGGDLQAGGRTDRSVRGPVHRVQRMAPHRGPRQLGLLGADASRPCARCRPVSACTMDRHPDCRLLVGAPPDAEGKSMRVTQ